MTDSPKPAARRWIHWLVTAMVFVALYAWMTRGNASPLIGEQAPDLSMAVAAGAEPNGLSTVRLSDMSGGVVVLDFWASWCRACKRTTPILNDLREEFAERGVAFYAVNVEPIDRLWWVVMASYAGLLQVFRAKCGCAERFQMLSISRIRSWLTSWGPADSFAGRTEPTL